MGWFNFVCLFFKNGSIYRRNKYSNYMDSEYLLIFYYHLYLTIHSKQLF